MADSGAAGREFGDHLAKRQDEVSEALLAITTDERGRNSGRPVIVKAHNTMRRRPAASARPADQPPPFTLPVAQSTRSRVVDCAIGLEAAGGPTLSLLSSCSQESRLPASFGGARSGLAGKDLGSLTTLQCGQRSKII